LADNRPNNLRILKFGTPLNLRLLKDSKIGYMDEILKVPLALFYLVCDIFAEVLGLVLYSLLVLLFKIR